MKELTVSQAVEILNNPSTHTWVKEQTATLSARDPIDAYYDALLVAELAKIRMNLMIKYHKTEAN